MSVCSKCLAYADESYSASGVEFEDLPDDHNHRDSMVDVEPNFGSKFLKVAVTLKRSKH